MKKKLKLNDFEGFDQYLFPNGKKDWHKFWAQTNGHMHYIPPIEDPVKLVDFQLNHYALWMSIAMLDDVDYTYEMDLLIYGYPCKYVEMVLNNSELMFPCFEKCHDCPITERYLGVPHSCHYAHRNWFKTKSKKLAWIYANCKWEERIWKEKDTDDRKRLEDLE